MANLALGRTEQAILTNESGGSLAQGDVVIIDSANAGSVTTTTTSGYVSGRVGVVLEPAGIANNASGMIAFSGYVPKLSLASSASLGHWVKTHTVAKQGTPHAAPMQSGDFAQVLGTGTSPAALLSGSVFSMFTPNRFEIDVLLADSHTNFGSFGAPDTGLGLTRYSSGAQNAEAVWSINLPAGTYTIALLHTADNNRGKYHFIFDGVDKGNVDGYGASLVITLSTVTGVALSGGTPVEFKAKMSDKNASSSNYFGVPYRITLIRTGA